MSEINPKTHAQKKRGKRHLKRRDYRYGGCFGHSVQYRTNNRKWKGEPFEIFYSEADSRLKKCNEKLPFEEKYDVDFDDWLVFTKKNYNQKYEPLRELLEEGDLPMTDATADGVHLETYGTGAYQVKQKVKFISFPQNDCTLTELNSIEAHHQAKQRKEIEGDFVEVGLGGKFVHARTKLRRWLPHGEITTSLKNERSLCMRSNKQAVITQTHYFGASTTVVGLGIQALHNSSTHKHSSNLESYRVYYMPPKDAKDQRWIPITCPVTNSQIWRGPETASSHREVPVEKAYDIIENGVRGIKCIAMKVESVRINFLIKSENNTTKSSKYWHTYIYGSKLGDEKNVEKLEQANFGHIKNPGERATTVISLRTDCSSCRRFKAKKVKSYCCSWCFRGYLTESRAGKKARFYNQFNDRETPFRKSWRPKFY